MAGSGTSLGLVGAHFEDLFGSLHDEWFQYAKIKLIMTQDIVGSAVHMVGEITGKYGRHVHDLTVLKIHCRDII